MKALFVCLTDYQLLNSINIKVHLLKGCKADIIIFNNKKGNIELADRLQSTGIFENVYVYSEFFTGLHKYLRGLTENKNEIGFLTAVKGTVKNIYLKLLGLVKDKEFIIQQKIHNNKVLDFDQYNQFFGIETKAFVGECFEAILKYNKCLNNSIDEGLASYLSYALKRTHKVDKVYLYEPDMAVYKDKIACNIVQIPKIDKDDKDFINAINFIFDFKDANKIDLKDKIIFFDQNTDPMPKYLRNAGAIKKFIFANPYKKHLKEQIVYETKMELFKKLVRIFTPQDVFVKLHPRSNVDYIEDYRNAGAKFFPNIFAPWEVFGANYEIKNNIWVTIYSSALCAYSFTIKNNSENKYIFLYKILNKNRSMNRFEEIDSFFSNFQTLYKQNVILPESVEEYETALKLIKE